MTPFEQYLAAAIFMMTTLKRALSICLMGESVAVFVMILNTGADYCTAIVKLNENFPPQKNALHKTYLL